MLLGVMLQSAPLPPIVPLPAAMERRNRDFVLDPNTRIVVSPASRAVGERLREALRAGTGYSLDLANRGRNAIVLAIDPKLGRLGPEGYTLDVSADVVNIRAAGEAGLFYGAQTLRQLLPPDTLRNAPLTRGPYPVPGVHVEDQPRFSWRGAHLDVSRHFMPKAFLLRFIDLMAIHKLNAFHLHLTDDQGWRMEIKRYPKLTSVGAWHRPNELTDDPTTWKTVPDGGFYTQDDLREVVAYAKARFVNVVPEIEMPGHAQAAVAAYPELGNDGKPIEVAPVNGGGAALNASPATVKFFQDVLTEVMDVFPSKFIHVGGDEVDKGPWKANPVMQAQIRLLGLKNEDELQSWFIKQMDGFLTAHGRRLIGWDEILEGGLAPGATVMSWRGIEGGIAAAKAGHDVVMAPTGYTYLDYYQSNDRSTEPQAIGGFVPLERVYSFDPITPSLSEDEGRHILGVQGQLWTEYIPNPRHVEYMAYPRLCAIAEVGWTPGARKSLPDFMARMAAHASRLRALDVNFRPLDPPQPPPVGAWKSGEMSETYAPHEWDVTSAIAGPGTYQVRFGFTGGQCRLDVEWAELLADGEVVARDAHFGRTGGEDKDNVYRFDLKSLKPGAKLRLRANVRTDGGTDSNGEIRVRRTA